MHKTCTKCKCSKVVQEFGNLLRSSDGLNHRCKVCDRKATKKWRDANKEAHTRMCTAWKQRNPDYAKQHAAKYNILNRAKRTANERNRVAIKNFATPKWFDKEEVLHIYELARERDLEVDHIVPLNSKIVCGLHVQDNLRCIPRELNRHKGNRYWPDQSWR